jgi:transposase-like protein
VNWNSLLREVASWRVSQNQGAIGGPGTTVEIDEILFAKRKNHAGRILPQQWVFGGICRETGECFIVPVPKRDATTLMPIILQKIRPGASIISDEWRAYRGIQAQGYAHLTVNHSRNFVDPTTGAHTQNIERSWRSAKERNKRQCGTSRGQLESYLDTFMWETRLSGRDPFDVILQDISAFMPPQ